jgi:GntR family transcriptional regulator, transcriptional repressor for pyruvate dehydrogenase complex
MDDAGKAFPRLKTKRTFELIVDLFKEKIVAGEYRIGDRLPSERELADMLKVGRPSVREAYRTLELLGVLEIRKGNEGGAFIRELDRQSASRTISDLLQFQNVTLSSLAASRLIIEKGLAEETIRRARPSDLRRLRQVLEANEAAVLNGTIPGRASLDLHLELARISGNPVMVMVLSSILDLMWLFLTRLKPDVETARQDLEEHRLIVAAVEDRQPQRLLELLDHHLQNSRARLEAVGRDTRSLTNDSVAITSFTEGA